MSKRKKRLKQNLGDRKIISNSNEFDKTLMEKIKLENIEDEEYIAYCNSFLGLTKRIKDRFPLLKFTLLPTKEKALAYIKGDLCDREHFENYGQKYMRKNNMSFPIFAILPLDYRSKGIRVFDACNRINQKQIPNEYLHFNEKNEICTHKPIDITPENAVIDVLQSAWHLYIEYQKFERTGRFDLNCYPHGGDPYER